MDFEEKLSNYAKLLVCHGLNVQEGQELYIRSEIIHRDFVMKVAEEAYRRGAKYVDVDLKDPRLGKIRLRETLKPEDLKFVPPYVKTKFEDMPKRTVATLSVCGEEDPDLLAEEDAEKVNTVQLSYRQAVKKFYEEGINKSKVHWTVASAPSEKWGQKVFPHLSGKEAKDALWEQIFKICRVDRPDFLEEWQKHNHTLLTRAKGLTDMKIQRLHFKGPGTDLNVYLSKKAKFKGGTDIGALGVPYEPNIPTEECFSTPDCRLTEGTARTTRPFMLNGKLIEGLELEFKKGKIVSFSATSGEKTFAEYIESDPGAKMLGEVALVGIDSPIYQSGLLFEETLFDENAACHIAIGSCYHFCIEGSEQMSKKELEEIGANESHTHSDMMISSEEVDVTAYTYDDKEIPLIRKGAWVVLK